MRSFSLVSFLIASNVWAAPLPPALLSSAQGNVSVDGKPGTSGQTLSPGAVVETGPDGKATLLLGKHNVVHLDSDARLKIAVQKQDKGMEETDLQLEHGRARALVQRKPDTPKRFMIRTRSAVMGVRGTHVYVDSPKDMSKPASFLTLDGVAEVRSGAAGGPAVTLEKNQSVSDASLSAGGSTPAPQAVSAATAAELSNSVAPPPAEVKTREQAESVASVDSGTTVATASRASSIVTVPAIPFDPVANSGGKQGPISIKIKVKSNE